MAAGVAGCLAVAALASWARFLVLGTLDLEDRGLALAHRVWPFAWAGAAFLGAGILFLRALRFAPAWRPRHLVVGAVAIHLVATTALPLTSRDAYSNLAYARLSATGRNPYLSGPADLREGEPVLPLTAPQWRSTPIVYGPITTMLTVLPGGVRSLPGLLALFKLEMLLFGLACIAAAFLICRSFAPDRSRQAFVLFAWNPLFAWEVSAQAHNDGILVLALLAFSWAASQRGLLWSSLRRQWLAALSLALGIYAKLAAAPAFAAYMVLVARKSVRRAVTMIAVAAAVCAALFLPFWSGAGTINGPFGTLPNHATRTTRSLADLARWLARPLGPGMDRWAYWIVAGCGIATCAWLGIRAAMRARSIRDVAHDGLLFLLLYDLIGAPWFQSWYGTWLLPFALVEEDATLRELVALYSVLLLVQYAVPIGLITYPIIDIYMLRRLIGLLRRQSAAALARPYSPVLPLAGAAQRA